MKADPEYFHYLLALDLCFLCLTFPLHFLLAISRKDLAVLFLAEGYCDSWHDFMCPPQTWTLRTLRVPRDVCKAQVLHPAHPKPTLCPR